MCKAQSTVTLIIALYLSTSRSSALKIKVKSEGWSRLTRQWLQSRPETKHLQRQAPLEGSQA